MNSPLLCSRVLQRAIRIDRKHRTFGHGHVRPQSPAERERSGIPRRRGTKSQNGSRPMAADTESRREKTDERRRSRASTMQFRLSHALIFGIHFRFTSCLILKSSYESAKRLARLWRASKRRSNCSKKAEQFRSLRGTAKKRQEISTKSKSGTSMSERHYYSDLESRRGTVLASIEKQGKLTDELKAKILACYSKNELEDLYLPYKPKRKTKASVAIERGLEPLANYIWEQNGEQPAGEFAQQFINPEKEVPTVEAAIEGRAAHRRGADRGNSGNPQTASRSHAGRGQGSTRRSSRARKRKRPSTKCTTPSRRPFRRFLLTECSRSAEARERAF